MSRRLRPHCFPFVSRYAIAALLFTAGCASEPPAFHVRFADMASGGARDYTGRGPLVIEFQPGDRFPVEFHFEGQHFELSPPPAMEMVAKIHCYVRFDRSGIHVSQDPEHFDQKPREPGRFAAGFQSKAGEPTKLTVSVVTPRQ